MSFPQLQNFWEAQVLGMVQPHLVVKMLPPLKLPLSG
jgi:hypothetical protein